ncbi:MAG: nitroreductase family protein [Desulfobacterales bacterium]|nr:nitroreductase family protein [Desulfobacterales bacterium]
MIEFPELLIKRRSIRDYEGKAVPLEIIRKIINESCLAPSSGNGQPWKFIIINNRNIIKRLSDESKKNLLADLENNPDSEAKKYEETLRDPNFNVFYNAPCLVLIAGPRKLLSLYVDCALLACYFMFSALEKRLGTCWIGLGTNIKDPALLKEIGMPADCKIVAPIIVGYPKSTPVIPERIDPQILKIVT